MYEAQNGGWNEHQTIKNRVSYKSYYIKGSVNSGKSCHNIRKVHEKWSIFSFYGMFWIVVVFEGIVFEIANFLSICKIFYQFWMLQKEFDSRWTRTWDLGVNPDVAHALDHLTIIPDFVSLVGGNGKILTKSDDFKPRITFRNLSRFWWSCCQKCSPDLA
jgi:hypothetical protein